MELDPRSPVGHREISSPNPASSGAEALYRRGSRVQVVGLDQTSAERRQVILDDIEARLIEIYNILSAETAVSVSEDEWKFSADISCPKVRPPVLNPIGVCSAT